MSYFKVIGIFLATVAVLAVSIIGFGCANNTESTSTAPEFEEPGPPPIEITVDQLYGEYTADEATADAKYMGERLLFYEVEVERVDGYWVYIGLGEWNFEKTFFISGSVKFRLQGEDYGIMQNIEEGYVLNIVGECRGLISGAYDKKPLILVYDCWVGSVVGDLGTGEMPDSY